jgi:hypothetical protein
MITVVIVLLVVVAMMWIEECISKHKRIKK